MTGLFRVTSVAEFRGYKNVVISWFVLERPVRLELPYAEMIEDGYDPTVDVDYIDPAGCLHEYFTEAEANALADYLEVEGNGRPVITPAKLPIPLNAMPFSNIPLGGEPPPANVLPFSTTANNKG